MVTLAITQKMSMTKQIEKQVSEYRTNGIALYVHDNGQPNYYDVKTMCDFAMIDFEEKDGEFVAVLLDDELKDLNYMLNSENIDKDTYDELVEELNKLKI